MIEPIEVVDLADEGATAALAEDVAARLQSGDLVALAGGLGAAKTTFARALIRAVVDDSGLEVPSPTFTLVQAYDSGRLPVTHFDLYRLTVPDELEEIGLAEAQSLGAVVLEWPERAEGWLPGDRLEITLEIAGDGRRATVAGGGAWPQRFARSRAARAFLDANDRRGVDRRHLQGDASTRTFERVLKGTEQAVLMDWPPTGAALYAGDNRAAFRARDIRAFIAVDNALRENGFSAPAIYAADAAEGFALMEDFGTVGIVEGDQPVAERYGIAVEVLAAIHNRPRPPEITLPDGSGHRLRRLAADVLTAETTLFLDCFMPHATGNPLDEDGRADFDAIWSDLFARVESVEQSWVLFDVQSPNLFWLPDREGTARVGLIDFQDMFVGPSAYDVASLCQDARVTIPAALEAELRDRYVGLRRAATPGFDVEAFSAAYTILGTLRTLKNLGLFARLADREGKRHYLRHIPRLREYLGRNLAHPVLSAFAVWYEKHLPPATGP